VINSQEIEEKTGIKRNALYNLEEIKVRWKKAALENCTGVPCVTAPSFTCGTSTVPDMDGNSYNTVLIGLQCWTKENLKVTMYNDGTAIPIDATGGPSGTSLAWQGLTTGAYTIYGNGTSTGTDATNYGFLYNWYAAVGIVTPMGSPTKNICPTGWHVPTDGQLTSLIQFIVPTETVSATATGPQSNTAGTLMKKNDALWTTNTGTNTSGFSALPGGYRDPGGNFADIRNDAYIWSASDIGGGGFAWFRRLMNGNGLAFRFNNLKQVGASVRCLRD
jgi:uncharacterized protein (TIGR02145 family)